MDLTVPLLLGSGFVMLGVSRHLGQIFVPSSSVCRRFWNRPKLTADSWRNG